MPSATVCVIGAGFAGAATAYFLTRAGVRDVVVLEQEDQPGTHASGNNAAMARQFILDPTIQPMAIRGTQFLYHPPAEVSERPLIRPIGSLILFDAAQEQTMRSAVGRGHGNGLTSSVVQRAECEARVPLLRAADFTGAVWTPTDGVVAAPAYLAGLLSAARARGARVHTSARVESIQAAQGTWVMTTTVGVWECAIIVNAAGAWADQVATLAGATPRRLQPLRRHLFQSAPFRSADPEWPYVWDSTHEYYFRPESGGLLLCACDEEPMPPGHPAINAAVHRLLDEKCTKYCPRLTNVPITKTWAGLRTFAPDRQFALGWDPRVPQFYWVAGLGGHGVTCAAAVGEQAATAITSGTFHQYVTH